MTASQIDEDVRVEVDRRLQAIESDNGVRILFAIESGSRAWGFPSPDSDYDVRFVYLHEPTWYLAIERRRDVIELPIEGDYDIGGWDLKKALHLLIKPNPVLLEWMASPIVYRHDGWSLTALGGLAAEVRHRTPARPMMAPGAGCLQRSAARSVREDA